MTRTYTLKKRAEQQEQTRRRIVEAAIDLHSSVGPALTTLSQVAERAGVQRHTLYAHFPDERSLYMACSGLTLERDPLPDAAAWRAIEDPRERLRVGLDAVYSWYERNAEYHPLTREIAELRFEPSMAAYQEVLGADLNATQQALLRLALSFFTWRTLACESGLNRSAVVGAMIQAIGCAKEA
jgi:AcrR family transcriptional regulator